MASNRRPILGTVRGCETDLGWRATTLDGRVLEVRSAHPGVRADMPGGAGWLRVRSPADGRLCPFIRFLGLGIYLFERKRKRNNPPLRRRDGSQDG